MKYIGRMSWKTVCTSYIMIPDVSENFKKKKIKERSVWKLEKKGSKIQKQICEISYWLYGAWVFITYYSHTSTTPHLHSHCEQPLRPPLPPPTPAERPASGPGSRGLCGTTSAPGCSGQWVVQEGQEDGLRRGGHGCCLQGCQSVFLEFLFFLCVECFVRNKLTRQNFKV